MIEKVNLESMDIIQDNIEKLKQIFPEIFSENKIDFEALKSVLGEEIDTENERYSFNWHGKNNARRIALEPSMGTLLPSKSESKNWESTENMYIEGDNLEVLKLLQKSYHNKIKMIYIDPPYNTGKDFVYKDNFKDNLKNYLDITGQTGAEGQKLSTNSDTSGRYHSDWLNMMYPRLKLARNLLTDDGVIFISIGDNEHSNLKKICDEIFGELNFIAECTRISKRTSDKGNYFKSTKDIILCYSKDISKLENKFGINTTINLKDYKYEDEIGKYKKNGASLYQPSLDSRPNQRYYIECPDGSFVIPPGNIFPKEIYDASFIKPNSNKDKVWRWSYNTYLKNKNKLIFTSASSRCPLINEKGEPAKWNIYDKVYLQDKEIETLLPEDVIYEYVNSKGTKELLELEIPFSFAKPSELILYLIKIIRSSNSDIILDFFSGSATTAHAVMKLNSEDGGNRKYIMVQLPEVTPEESEAYKDGYKTICEIGKERIRRAGEKIKSDESLPLENREKLDIGFKVFKLDTSNIKEWDSETGDLKQSLFDSVDNIKTERTSLDILYEVLLKYGLDLNVPIVKKENFYSINVGTLLINLEKEITLDVIDSMCEEYKNLIKLDEDYKTTVVLRDNSFKNNIDKTNAIQRLKQAGIKEIRSI